MGSWPRTDTHTYTNTHTQIKRLGLVSKLVVHTSKIISVSISMLQWFPYDRSGSETQMTDENWPFGQPGGSHVTRSSDGLGDTTMGSGTFSGALSWVVAALGSLSRHPPSVHAWNETDCQQLQGRIHHTTQTNTFTFIFKVRHSVLFVYFNLIYLILIAILY